MRKLGFAFVSTVACLAVSAWILTAFSPVSVSVCASGEAALLGKCFARCTCPDGSTRHAGCEGLNCQAVNEQGCTAENADGQVVDAELCAQVCAEDAMPAPLS